MAPEAAASFPLVSMIMPAWEPNGAWLLQAVQSALGQRECNLELIVVDDGCSRPVSELLADVRDPRIRLARIDHGGESAARNAGFSLARGSWIRFIDCDDVLEPNSTARLLRSVDSGQEAIAHGATVVCDESLHPLWKMASRRQGRVVNDCLLNRFWLVVSASLFPRTVVEEAGEWDPTIRVSADWDFALRALEHAPLRAERGTALYYRRHESAASTDRTAGGEGALRVVEGYFERHPEQRGSRLQRQAAAMLEVLKAQHSTRGRPWTSARFWRAGVTDPRAVASFFAYWMEVQRGRVMRVVPFARRLAGLDAISSWLPG